jgi:hypothetical protein
MPRTWMLQLLPTEEEARFIRDVINYYITEEKAKGNLTETEEDLAWGVLADITQKMRQARRG